VPEFHYLAKDENGNNVSGSVTAASEGEAILSLHNRNLAILSLTGEAPRRTWSILGRKGPTVRVKVDELAVFMRQLSTMIGAGLPVLEALEVLQERMENRGFKWAIRRIISDVRGGSALSHAMSQHPAAFNNLCVNMIVAGEASGQLDIILTRLAEYLEDTAALRRSIKAAMAYPVVVLTLILGITIFLMVFIVPRFKDIYDSLKVDLPGITSFILNLSVFLQNNFIMVFLGMIALAVAILIYSKTEFGGRQVDWLKLNVPVFGPLFSKVALSRFSRTFATLIDSGVPILGSLDIVAAAVGNRLLAQDIREARESVRQGTALAVPLSASPRFPPMVSHMVAVGERSGSLGELLHKVSEFYDQQVKAAIESLTSLIEPLMIAVMGCLVGSIVLSVFLPILRIQEVLAKH